MDLRTGVLNHTVLQHKLKYVRNGGAEGQDAMLNYDQIDELNEEDD